MDVLFGAPPPHGDQDRGPTVFGLYWAIVVVCFFFMSLRIWARVQIHALGWDDWTMAFSVLLLLALTITGTLMALNGGCRHLYYLIFDKGLPGVVTVAKLFYICQPFAIMGIAIGRISVALLVLRIMALTVWRKRFLWFSIVSTFIISALNSGLLFAACSPVEGIWNPFIQSTCWNSTIMTNVTIFTSSWNVLMDFCFAVLPVSVFWTLKLSVKKRVGLCVLTGMGVLAGISGAVKTSKLHEVDSSDSTWATYDLLLWNAAETFLIILCGCLPTLRPLYLQLFRHRGKNVSEEPSYELRSSKLKQKNSDSGDLDSDDRFLRSDPTNKPSINPSVINVGHSLDLDMWSKTNRNETMPIQYPHGTQYDGEHWQATSRAALEV